MTSGKNLRLLGREKGPGRQPTIQEIIVDLQREIEQGLAVYSEQELAILERKLAEYETLLERMLSH
ncbi:hypothetical protein [Geobacter argillaceus]|uniref:Gas vesicle protein GvpG n=1 Tax=Geobacter argillaceus TaxID=345631 RepID=A0A562VIE1_9BACT|nr:hypothetical protein [Geobacter argillaceus]TWJ17554.1 hypothetical protein JN12_02949 [Geobacter argillaceus]